MLEVDIFNIDEFIKVNNLREVTNPILLEKDNIPTYDGLLSYDIFGRTTKDRQETYAYINLNGHFIHPLIYNTWRRMNRIIEGIVSGTQRVSVDKNGSLVKDPEGWTGLEELYRHFDEIKFVKNNSATQNERISLFNNLKKDEIFVSKWIVMPAFFRDLQLAKVSTGKISTHVLTEIYSKILRLANGLKNDVTGLDMVTNSTRNRIQGLLRELYSDNLMSDIKGKDGKFRKDVIGKSVDYGARLVISAPLFNVNRSDEMITSFEYAGVSLATCCVTFFPFILKWLKDYFNKEVYMMRHKYPVMNKQTGEVEYVKLKNVEKYNDEYFTKAIDLFVHSYNDRIKTIELEVEDRDPIKMFVIGQYTDEHAVQKGIIDSTIIKRPLTWTDLLYRAAVDVTKDKHILATRCMDAPYISDYISVLL